LAISLLAPVIEAAFKRLEELRDRGKIPSATIPVLQDRLEAQVCICGESLSDGDIAAAERRANIQRLIGDSQKTDAIQEMITELYYGAKPMQAEDAAESSGWLGDYARVVERRDGIADLRDEAGRKFRAYELQLDSLPDTDVQGLRATRRQFSEQRDRHLARQSALETQLAGLGHERDALTSERDRLLREQRKGARVLAELEVVQDVTQVLQSAYERITSDELNAVSDLMDRMFREMIGADPEQNAIIRRAAISAEFDIIVYGPGERTLNPDRDLNGASRRALTLAFILALTKVSEVEAPNVIDTPLGMTSGFVKRSMLRVAVRESAQLILFLTHAEIAGCEDIIDEAAGEVVTLTNLSHYPTMLVNDPGVTEHNVIRCSCDHRGECAICQRRVDLYSEPQPAE
jgi:DNA sulfur modification protein DndD